MKKIISLALILMTFVFFSPNETDAQIRIQLARGKNSATVSGNTGSYAELYVVRHRAGQKLALNLSPNSSKVGIVVQNDAGDDVLLRKYRGGYYEVYLEDSGDARITVITTNGKSVPFTLTVTITNISDI
jgi:hypothetical protein